MTRIIVSYYADEDHPWGDCDDAIITLARKHHGINDGGGIYYNIDMPSERHLDFTFGNQGDAAQFEHAPRDEPGWDHLIITVSRYAGHGA